MNSKNNNHDRLPPHSTEAEQSLLGCVLLNPWEVFGELSDKLHGEMFYDKRHANIWEAMKELTADGKQIDVLTLREQMVTNKTLWPDGLTYIAGLPEQAPSAHNWESYLEIIQERYAQREIIRTSTAISRMAFEGELTAADMIDSANRSLSDLAVQFSGEKKCNMKEIVARVMESFEAAQHDPGAMDGLPTGFIDLDKIMRGMKPGNYIVIAGRPSVGKTAIALNIVEHVALDLNMPVGVFSLEMIDAEVVARMIASRARVDIKNIMDGFMANRDIDRITIASGKINQSPIYIDDTGGMSLSKLRARARKMVRQHGIKLLVVDYLQLIQGESGHRENRREELDRISVGIKALLKELGIPGIILAQLNRDIERGPVRAPRLSDLRDSGQIEQDADFVAMLWSPHEADEGRDETAVRIDMAVRKHRNGPTGTVHFTFFKQFTRYESAAKVTADDVPEQRNFYPD